MKKVLSVVLALAMMLGLCGTAFAAVSQADIVGVWNMDMNAILNMMGEDEETIETMKPFLSMMKCTMEFTAEGTYAMKMSFLGEEENMEGNYELADGKISMDGGDFAEAGGSVSDQLRRAKARVAHKNNGGKYIAYFQAYTNTYAPVGYLRHIYTEALSHPEVCGISIATRPDCHATLRLT